MIAGMGLGTGSGGGGRVARAAREASTAASTDGRVADPVIRDQVVQHMMDTRCFVTTLRRSSDEAKAGQGPGPASSMFKLYGTELNKRSSSCS